MKNSFKVSDWRTGFWVGALFVLLLLAYHGIFRNYFPLPSGYIGHDYAFALPELLDGYLWFRNNGFITPPWFTPSFCAGQPYFADPQSIFYSVPQFLAFVVDPLRAIYLSVLLFAGIGFWGMYVLCRRSFVLSVWAALAASTVFMFNGFYAHRMIVGHVGYQPFMLVPWVAWLLIGDGQSNRFKTALSVLIAGLLIAYWLQAGLTTLMVPSGIAVLALGCMATLREPSGFNRLILRGISAAAIALCISASKLAASLALMSHFPRDYYPLPGISNLGGLLEFIFQALFYSSEHAYKNVTPLWRNMQWSAMPHELAYGVTLVPLFVLLLGSLIYLRGKVPVRDGATSERIQFHILALLTGIVLLPMALLFYSPEWNAFLKRIPLIGSTTSPFRWLIIYVPIIAVLCGMVADVRSGFSKMAAVVCLVGIPFLNAVESRGFYQNQSYDPSPILKYDQAVRSGRLHPEINTIGVALSPSGAPTADNTLFTQGVSPLICYNPLFGYRLEKYSTGSLHVGNVLDQAGAEHLNFRNPACLVFPRQNHCVPWEGFRAADAERLENFVHYQPFNFARGIPQKLADFITEASLVSSALLLIALLFVSGRNLGSR